MCHFQQLTGLWLAVFVYTLPGGLSRGIRKTRIQGMGCDLCSFFAVCLQDSVLAFWKHGMQGKSFKSDEVTQEISDETRVFRLLGSDRVVVLESRPTENPTAHSNLYILAGHENSYWATLTHQTTEGIGHTGAQECQKTGTCRFLSWHQNCVGFWGGNQSIFAAGNSWFCLLPLCGWLYRVCLIKAEIKSPLLISSRETEPWNMFCSKGAINC